MEAMQFIGLGASLPAIDSFGVQRFHLVAGIMESDTSRSCRASCDIHTLVGSGDGSFVLTGRDHAADKARERQRSTSLNQG